jgi:hypothetical protein
LAGPAFILRGSLTLAPPDEHLFLQYLVLILRCREAASKDGRKTGSPHTFSITMAMPWPTPMHMVASA